MKIGFIVLYYGKWPPFYELWVRSIAANPTIAVLIVTDLPQPALVPANVKILNQSRFELEARFSRVLGCDYRIKGLHKLCELRPFYGLAFQEFILSWDYWGFCDMDLVFGNLTPLCEAAQTGRYGLISPWNYTAGHCTLVRNREEENRAGFALEDIHKRLNAPENTYCDEGAFAHAAVVIRGRTPFFTPDVCGEWLKSKCFLGASFAPPCRLSGAAQWDTFAVLCEEGRTRVLDEDGKYHEVLYFHFMGGKSNCYWRRFEPPGNFPFSFLPDGFQPGLTSLEEMLSLPAQIRFGFMRAKAKSYMMLHSNTPVGVRRGMKRMLSKLRGVGRT